MLDSWFTRVHNNGILNKNVRTFIKYEPDRNKINTSKMFGNGKH